MEKMTSGFAIRQAFATFAQQTWRYAADYSRCVSTREKESAFPPGAWITTHSFALDEKGLRVYFAAVFAFCG